jgi:hypothetical protein
VIIAASRQKFAKRKFLILMAAPVTLVKLFPDRPVPRP